MSVNEYRNAINESYAKNELLKLLHAKAPNSIRIKRVYEMLIRGGTLSHHVDKAINDLEKEGAVVIHKRPRSNKFPAINSELERRDSISLSEYPKTLPIRGEYHIGEYSVVRLLSGDIVSGEDINEITEALKQYVDKIDATFDERVRKETAKIYRQMIGIFGIFVSIFSILVISTDKMLRFSPEILQNNPVDLFIKSVSLFLPVGIIIGALLYMVTKVARDD